MIAAEAEQERKQEEALKEREVYLAERAQQFESDAIDKAKKSIEFERKGCMTADQASGL